MTSPTTSPSEVSVSQPGQVGLPRNVKLLGWASCVNDVASEMSYPLLQQFLLFVLRGNLWHLGVIEGVAESVASLVKLWAGAWSDRLGRRRWFVVLGYALAAVARPLMGLAAVPWHMFAARTADRLGKGLRTSPRDALIADSTPQEMRGRAFGFHRAMDHLGAAIGPLLALVFLWFWPGELRGLFLLTAVPGLVVVALVIAGVREAPAVSAETSPSPAPRLTLRPFDRDFRLYLLALVVFTLGNSSDAFLLVRAKELGVPVGMLPVLWFAFHVLKSGGNLLVGRWVDKAGPRLPLLAGWTVYAALYAGFAAATSAWQMWALFLAYALFYSLSEPAEKALLTRLAGDEHKGLAFGWFHFAIGMGALPASALFGLFYDRFGAFVAFGWGASLAVIAAALLLAVRVPALRISPPAKSA
jgi:MFS family permease